MARAENPERFIEKAVESDSEVCIYIYFFILCILISKI
jgi:hypothetical protein